MGAPHCRYFVRCRQRQLRVIRDIQHREVILEKCPDEATESERHEEKLTVCGCTPDRHHGGVIAVRSD